MKRGLVMKRDCRWVRGLGAMLVLAMAAGCGKIPTWGELTGQTPPAPPPKVVPVVQPPSVSTPVKPVEPPKPNAVEVIAQFKALPPFQVGDESLLKLASLTEGLENLTEINASGGSVTDNGLANLNKLPALKKLELVSTKISNQGMQHLSQVSSLEWLNLNSTPITDAGVATLTALPNLKKLELKNCQLTPEGFAAIGRMPALEEINLDVTPGLNDVTLDLMCEARTLRRLHLRDCGGITDKGLSAMRKLEVLEELNINRCQITGEGFLNVSKQGGLKSLKLLGISVAPLTDKGAKAINSLRSLEYLDLQQTSQMNDVGLVEIVTGMKQLKYLNIAECKLVTGLKSFAALKAAEDLETLRAFDTSINDTAIALLKGHKKLKLLEIGTTTKCTLKGVQLLKKSLPDCEIRFGGQSY
ncbi:MAG: hypothetical protein AABP62_03090 [Planctomycetota bacterium]